MKPETRTSNRAPFHWVACVLLFPSDVRNLLAILPSDSDLADQIKDTANEAAQMAEKLNEVERQGIAND